MLPSATSAALVAAFYNDLLHRAPDPGSAYFVQQLDSGVTPAKVAYEIETDPGNEYRMDLVAQDYQTLLKRVGAPSELTGWVNLLDAGASDQQVAAMVAGTPEYYALHGSTTTGFLNGLYTDALGRPDSEGAFVTAVNQGVSRQSVAEAVFTSPEGLLHQVLADYEQFLGRSGVGDPGAAEFASAMASGVSHEVVVSDLLGSPEYQALHPPVIPPNSGGGQPDNSPSPDTAVAPAAPVPIDIPAPDPVVAYSPPVDTGSTDTGTYDDTSSTDTSYDDTSCGCTSDPGYDDSSSANVDSGSVGVDSGY